MKSNSYDNIKFKLLTIQELIINLDRISRFKLPELTYKRVFISILNRYLITPKYSKTEIEMLDYTYVSKIVKKIWNESVKLHFPNSKQNLSVNLALKLATNSTFKNIDKNIKILINTHLNFSPILENINYDTAPQNLKFLKKVSENFNSTKITYKDLEELRLKYSLLLPVKKLVIVEGITEEILLPIFANALGYNFDKNGIFLLGAGGKSKSPTLYYQLKNYLKIPINFLFDDDAIEIYDQLKNILEKKDNAIIIENGEFEDILSLNLIKRALNNEYLPATMLTIKELRCNQRMCKNLEYFYRTRHLGEFKKSKISKIIAKNVKYKTDVTEEIMLLIKNLV